MQPDLAYFTDPDQNFISDFFQALTPSGTQIGQVQGVLPDLKPALQQAAFVEVDIWVSKGLLAMLMEMKAWGTMIGAPLHET